ncbi:MAG: maleylpyruvate isomerase N-terminal domain-containing protein [bacterium]|nr:maleylpyruvate isomerase N-terminal domain-containing protein [bacterium]
MIGGVGIAEAVASRHRELAGVLEAVEPDIVSADSQLPGWSRLNIVCHLRYGAQASHRMTSDALAGQPTAFYPGGVSAQRPSTLHPGPQESPADVV